MSLLARKVVASGLALVLAVAGCAGRDGAAPPSFRSCDEVACTGELNGVKYQIRLPQVWNGTLLLYAHEFRAAGPFPPAFARPRTDAPVAGDGRTVNALLEAGYALAGTTRDAGGYALREGVEAGRNLYWFFHETVGVPERTYVWGESLGGVVSELLAEQEDWVDGALPMCAALAGTNANFDLALDVAFAFKTLLYPEMKLTGYRSDAEARAVWTQVRRRATAALSGGPDQVGRLMLVSALGNQTWKSRDHDDATIGSRNDAGLDVLFEVMGYATIVRYDLEQRVFGNPSSNTGARYDERVSATERQDMEFVDPGGLTRHLAELARAPRVTADAAARRRADLLGDPTGALRVPTLTLHTGYDAAAIVANETVFANRALRSTGRTGDLMQLSTTPPARYTGSGAPYGAGHCNFTADERVGAVTSLNRWVRTGARPSLTEVAIALRGTSKGSGFDPLFAPGPWPSG
ncbi:alpha/beta hydrolase [Cryptosporangium arvum]|uniref:alpha/beta hydrolase n=1 Tax=Cryptosporangium arvum TaxID=80871 RepID=UPI0004B20F86|nr:alpha/beta hydrolase [Cryptosporangium arvum]